MFVCMIPLLARAFGQGHVKRAQRSGILYTNSVSLLISACFVNELYECENKLDQCILYADFELDQSHTMKIISW